MPRVNIREIDLTGSENTTYIENITLVPGVKIQLIDPETDEIMLDEDGRELTLDGTYETLDQFESKVTDIFVALKNLPVPESGDPNYNLRAMEQCFIQDKGYAIAYLILNGGLPVQYAGLYDLNITPSNIESGDTQKYIVEPNFEDSNIKEFYKQFEDRGKFDPKFITVPDFDYVADDPEDTLISELAKYALTCAGNRGDAYALLSVPSKLRTSKAVNKWINDGDIAKLAGDIIPRPAVSWTATDSVEQYGSYGAVFNPNFLTTFTIIAPFKYSDSPATRYTFTNEAFPAFVNYLLCYGKYTKVTPDWFAISGSTRGVTPLAKFILLNKYGDADVDLLEPRNKEGYSGNDDNTNHVAINAMCNIRPYGDII